MPIVSPADVALRLPVRQSDAYRRNQTVGFCVGAEIPAMAESFMGSVTYADSARYAGGSPAVRPGAQLIIMRAGRPRSQEIPEPWSRYHAARSRTRRTPANAETLTLRTPASRGPSTEAWAGRVSQARQCVRLTRGPGHG